jgi:60 kDa SS-A/Ro ribonucleoprotein
MYTHLSSTSGGTNVSSCLKLANNYHETAPLFIILSDNQSWMGNVFGEHTSAKLEWAKYNQQTTTKNGKPSKLICWDLSPSITTQIQTDSNVLNIGGYTDNVFQVIKYFNDFESPEKWTDLIENLNPFED